MRTHHLRFVTLPLLLAATCLLNATSPPQDQSRNRRRKLEPANLPGPQAPEFKPLKVAGKFEPIVDARVISASKVTNEVGGPELVLGVVVEGEARAYPINMLTGPSREIINDTLGGRQIAATW